MTEKLKYKGLGYIVSTPLNFNLEEKHPTVILLHGAGSRGNDLEQLAQNPFFVHTKSHNLQAIAFAPQCNADTWFDIFERLQDFIEYCISLSYVDENRVYLVGASMGGYATWQMAMTHPEWFAAVVPICGGGMYWNAHRLKDMNVWAFHGADDATVLCRESEIMVERINQSGGNAKLTVFADTGHDSWTKVYKNKEFFDWLIGCERGAISDDPDNDKYKGSELFG